MKKPRAVIPHLATDESFWLATDFQPRGFQGNPDMKLPTFVRKTQQAAPVRMFDQRALPSDMPSQGSPTGTIGRSDIKFAARLPESAQIILRDLADKADELNVMSHALHGRRHEILDAKGQAEARIYQHQSPMNTYRDKSGPEIENQKKIIAECQADLRRLEGRNAEHNAETRVFGQLIEAARSLVRQVGPVPITLHTGPLPQLRKNETAPEAVENLRRRLRELSADKARTEAASHPSADSKKEWREFVLTRGKSSALDAFPAIEQGLPIQLPTKLVPDGSGLVFSIEDAVGLMFRAFPDVFITMGEADIDAVADDESALSDVDREAALAQIRRDVLAIEREEVFFVRMASTQGRNILFRADTDPRALLGLADSMPAPRAA